jgi:hypothetical protein
MRVLATFLTFALWVQAVQGGGGGPVTEESGTGWDIEFLDSVDSVVDGHARTTIRYQLNVISSDEKDLSHWVLGGLSCSSWDLAPGSGFGAYGKDGSLPFSGYKWDTSTAVNGVANGVEIFTFVADSTSLNPVDLAQVPYLVKGGTYYEIKYTTGPTCETIRVPTCEGLTLDAQTCSVGRYINGAYTNPAGTGAYTSTFSLSSTSNVDSFQWSSDAGQDWISHNTNSAALNVTLIPSVACGATHTVTWEGVNFNHDGSDDDRSATCSASFDIEDNAAPVYVGSAMVDRTAEAGDIPAAPTNVPFEDCTGITVDFTEVQSSQVLPYTLTRTWVAKDACNNEASVSEVITVADTTIPDLLGVTNDETVECSVVPPPCEVLASDASGEDILISYNEVVVNQQCANTYDIIRTWSASDSSGNVVSDSQTISVLDDTPPVMTPAPGDTSVECNGIPAPAQLSATDNCDEDVTVAFSQHTVDHPYSTSYDLVRTWSASDNCGNTVTATQTITVHDTLPPHLDSPDADTTLECTEMPEPCVVEAKDACDGDTVVTFSKTTSNGPCDYDYVAVYTWTSVDATGNSASVYQTVTVVDDEAPTWHGGIHDQTAECDDIPSGEPYALDNCAGRIPVTGTEEIIPGANAAEYTIIRTWTAVDPCGNDAEFTQTIDVSDNMDPRLEGVPSDITLDCSTDVPTASVSVIDNCCTDNDVSMAEFLQEGSCDESYVLRRHWSAEDCSGNAVGGVQTITVEDTTAPTLHGVPVDATMDAAQFRDLADAVVTATDDCSDVSVLFTEDQTDGTCEQSFTVVREWTAVDACGHSVSDDQTIQVVDYNPPDLSDYPEDITVDCSVSVSAPTLTAYDAELGAAVTVDFSETFPENSHCRTLHLRVWTAVDPCGNVQRHEQNVLVTDTTPPEWLTYPEPTVVYSRCDETIPTYTKDDASGTDDCGIAIVSMTNSTSGDGVCQATHTYEFDLADSCGNAGPSKTAYVHMQALEPPEFQTTVVDDTVKCLESVPAAPTVVALDQCNEYVQILGDEQNSYTNCDNIIRRSWVATDICNQVDSLTQTIYVHDDEPPTMTPADDITLFCGDILVDVPEPEADDNCEDDLVSLSWVQTSSEHYPAYSEGVVKREVYTWTAIDTCLNSETSTVTVTWYDQTPPTITAPDDITAPCHDIPDTDAVGADACYTSSTSFTEQQVAIYGACDYEYKIIRTWTVIDAVGLTASDSQTVHVFDDEAPTISYPSNWTDISTINVKACDPIPPAPTLTATDNCGSVSETYTETTTEYNALESDIVRSWTFVDECGLTASASQTLHITDTTDPVISHEPSVQHTFSDECLAPDVSVPPVTDVCGSPTLESTYEVIEDDCQRVTVYTWSATDEAGNTATATTTVIVNDVSPPTFDESYLTLAVDETFENNSDNPWDETAYISSVSPPDFDDNCGATPDLTLVKTEDCSPLDFVIEFTATIQDCASDPVTHQWTVTVQDTTVPTLLGVPDDSTVSCVAPAPATVTTDTSGASVTAHLPVEDLRCEYDKTVTYSYTATSSCGETATDSYEVDVTNSPPTIDSVDNNSTQCMPVEPPPPAVGDDCETVSVSGPVVTSVLDAPVGLSYPYASAYTWSVMDTCGLSAETSATVTVEDTEAPVFISLPNDVTIEYTPDALPNMNDLEYTDNCGAELESTERRVDGTCLYAFYMLRTWTVTDYAGNVTSHTQTIEMQDTTPPVLSNDPADLTVQYSELSQPIDASNNYGWPVFTPTITATDTSGGDITVSFTETAAFGENPHEFNITRYWTAVDDCGNTAMVQQIITVHDDIPPPLNVLNITIECDNVTAYETTSAVTARLQSEFDDDTQYDGQGITVSFQEPEQRVPGTCDNEFKLVRTFVATDAAGNTKSATYTITVVDTTIPQLTGELPASRAYECSLPDPPTVTAEDNCGTAGDPMHSDGAIDAVFSKVENDDGSETWTWIAVDACGHQSSPHSITVWVQDTIAPVFVTPLPDVEVEYLCAAEDPPTVDATDNCGVVSVTLISTPNLDCGGRRGTIIHTWTAIDAYSNTNEFQQTVTVTDSTAPTFDPLSIEYEESEQCSPSWPNPTASDNCEGVVVQVIQGAASSSEVGNATVWTRTWTAHDGVGCNYQDFTATITVQDTTPPDLSPPDDVTGGCNEEVDPGDATTNGDNCEGGVTITRSLEDVTGDLCDGLVNLYKYTAVDEAGNQAVVYASATVTDSETPDLSWGYQLPPSYLECTAPTVFPVAHASDCSSVSVTVSPVTVPGTCADEYSVSYVAVATDECGLTSTDTFGSTTDVGDSISPTFDDLPDQNVINAQCDWTTPAPILTASDTCSTATVSGDETRVDLSCGFDLYRSWHAVDECGNDDSVTQTVEVRDTTPPVIDAEDATMECKDEIPDVTPLVTDNCRADFPASHVSGEVVPELPGTYALTFEATDDCTPPVQAVVNVVVKDTTPPVLTVDPYDATVNTCTVTAPTVTATDVCSDADVFDNHTPPSSECVNGDTVTTYEYEWYAEDHSGNTSPPETATITQTISGLTWSSAVMTEAPDITVECSLPPPASLYASHECVDGLLLASYVQVPANYDEAISEYVRTWTVTHADYCEPLTHTQTIIVEDVTDPWFTNVGEWSGECSNNCLDTDGCTPSATAADNCDSNVVPTWTIDEMVQGTCGHEWTRTVTYVATDYTGNTNTTTGVWSWVDTTPPQLIGEYVFDLTVDCNMPSDPNVEAQDNCDTNVQAIKTETIDQPMADCDDYTVQQQWDAVDDCGNAATPKTRTVTVVDKTPPELFFLCDGYACDPSDLTESCDDRSTAPAVSGMTDNCDTDCTHCDFDETTTILTSLCESDFTLARFWSVSDACGNPREYTQTVTVYDNEAPTISADASVTIDCEALPDIGATVSDNCAEVTMTHTIANPAEGADVYHGLVVTHTFTAFDECGLSDVEVVTVSVIDTTPPVLDIEDETLDVECDEVPYRVDPTASDNCGPVTVVCTEVLTPSTCDQSYRIVRTCVATDDAGNTDTSTLTINVSDTVAPSLDNLPALSAQYYNDNSVIVDGSDAIGLVVSVDNCDPNPDVTVTGSVYPGTCEGHIVTTLTWVATDDCGNTNTATTSIEQFDTEPCIFTEEPADAPAECDSIPEACRVVCVDDSDGPVDFTERTEGNLIIRDWSHVDACGNAASHSQTVTVADTTPPVLSREPKDETVTCDCDTFPQPPAVYALDNCDDNVSVVFVETKLSETSAHDYVLERKWTATDDGGNVAEWAQTITVSDDQAPTIVFGGQNGETVLASCGSVPDATAALVAYDNCDETVETTLPPTETTEYANEVCGEYTSVRTWTATDATGNTASVTQTVSVTDTEGPTFTAVAPVCVHEGGSKYAVFTWSTDLFPSSSFSDACSAPDGQTNITPVGYGTDAWKCNAPTPDLDAQGLCRFVDANALIVSANLASDENERKYEVVAEYIDGCGTVSQVSVPIYVQRFPDDSCGLKKVPTLLY